jgi:hypothetical protein
MHLFNSIDAGHLLPHAELLEYESRVVRERERARVVGGVRLRLEHDHRERSIFQRKRERSADRAAADDENIGTGTRMREGSSGNERYFAD